MARRVALIGSAIGWGSSKLAGEDGPAALRDWGLAERLAGAGVAADWAEVLAAEPTLADRTIDRPADALPFVGAHVRRLADAVLAWAWRDRLPVTIGGDHTTAIGHYAGLVRAVPRGGRLGIVWIDAHPDLNTPETSPSMAYHGMALAAILGHGDPNLAPPALRWGRIKPANVALIGCRSLDDGERHFIEANGLRVFGIAEVRKRGLADVLAEAVATATAGTMGYGLTIDLDAIDPADAPGVAFPEPGGLPAEDVAAALAGLKDDHRLTGIEISEYHPPADRDHRTAEVVARLLTSVLAQ